MNLDATPEANAATEDEDEAFEELEQRLRDQKVERYMQRATIEAARFIHDNRDQLGILTLRKAFEMGYRLGYSDAANKTHQDA
jgi:flagellar biosynthesis/type III secretory pathway protein FliH